MAVTFDHRDKFSAPDPLDPASLTLLRGANLSRKEHAGHALVIESSTVFNMSLFSHTAGVGCESPKHWQ